MSNIAQATTKEVVYLDVQKVVPNPNQPRKVFVEDNIKELANSIKEHGVLQPINVRFEHGKYELIAGERRLRACKEAGFKYIPALIANISEKQSSILAMIENIQREDLNYLEEAEGVQMLLNEYNMTQEELAEKLGKTQSTVANKLRILKLPKQIRYLLIENNLTERHARALLKLKNEEDMLEVLKKVVKDDLNVRKTETLIEKYLEKKEENRAEKGNMRIKRIIKDIRVFTNSVINAVEIMNESGVPTDFRMKEVEGGYQIIIDIETDMNKQLK